MEGPCKMNFRNFPLDITFCELLLESYPYNNVEVSTDWIPTQSVRLLLSLLPYETVSGQW